VTTSLSMHRDDVKLQHYLSHRFRIQEYLDEDIGTGDITSGSVLPENISAEASVWCKVSTEEVVLCGIEEASIAFELCGCSLRKHIPEGTVLKQDQKVLSLTGNARSLLKAERTALNLLMRMSGIATESRRCVEILRKLHVDTKVSATRKTSPGMRVFDKKAVKIGGGFPHRMRLDDMILIKDNHIVLMGTATKCIRNARKHTGINTKIECEVRSTDELLSAVWAGADIVMLDNFSVKNAKVALSKLQKLGLRKGVQVEISGGINSSNIREYALLKPDFVSIGSLTHSPKAVDFSMVVRRKGKY
jgi:nicotinate-nucleotide pyrophosphorylase (carboxylating)